MDRAEHAARDVALAVQGRAKFGKLLTEDDKRKIASAGSVYDLISYLRRCPGWQRAASAFPLDETDSDLFSLVMDREVYRDFESMYHFAQKSSQEFLMLIALRIKSMAVLAVLRRLANPGTKVPDIPLTAFLRRLPGFDAEALSKAKDYASLTEAVDNGIYKRTLRSLPVEKSTGLPNYAIAADAVEDAYYLSMKNFLKNDYRGAGAEALSEAVEFSAGLLNLSRILRLRRFRAGPEDIADNLIPLSGNTDHELEEKVITAATDEEAAELIMNSRMGRILRGLDCTDIGHFVRCANQKYFRRVIRGEPGLAAAYAFMVLKETECQMLKRVFVALSFGEDPADYM